MFKKFIKYIFLFYIGIITTKYCTAQTDTKKAAAPTLITADSLASGNYKNVLSSFFQLAVNNLTGTNKELHFVANPFAIMLRGDSTLAVNTNYLNKINRFWRRLNFDLDAKLDSAYHFNGFSIGIKFDLLNKRDISMSRAFGNSCQ